MPTLDYRGRIWTSVWNKPPWALFANGAADATLEKSRFENQELSFGFPNTGTKLNSFSIWGQGLPPEDRHCQQRLAQAWAHEVEGPTVGEGLRQGKKTKHFPLKLENLIGFSYLRSTRPTDSPSWPTYSMARDWPRDLMMMEYLCTASIQVFCLLYFPYCLQKYIFVPGSVDTRASRHVEKGWYMKPVVGMIKVFSKTSLSGAQTTWVSLNCKCFFLKKINMLDSACTAAWRTR